MPVIRAVGSIKRLGGTGFQGHFWILKRAPKKFPPEMLATMGGGERKIILYPNILNVFDQFFLKTSKFQNKKGTFHAVCELVEKKRCAIFSREKCTSRVIKLVQIDVISSHSESHSIKYSIKPTIMVQ